MMLNEDEISLALEHLYMSATKELKEFNNADYLKKVGIEKDSIL